MDKSKLAALAQPPQHIVEATEALKAEASKIHEETDEISSADDPKNKEVYPFHFEWKDGAGRVWAGDFEDHVLTIGERQMKGVIQARLAGGMPSTSIDPLTMEINLMVAHMELSLKERPAWAKDLRGLHNTQILYKLYEEVASHEATFLGWGPGAGPSEK